MITLKPEDLPKHSLNICGIQRRVNKVDYRGGIFTDI
jgi:hypothetical protein